MGGQRTSRPFTPAGGVEFPSNTEVALRGVPQKPHGDPNRNFQ